MEKQNKTEYRLSGIYSFFCWCSGARLYLLKKCPTEYNKFFGIGIIIFMTGILAGLSGSYALYTIFNSVAVSAVFGAIWGILIFFLDWYLVASLKKENKLLNELKFALPRIILAIFISIVISKPIELKLFEKEINNELENQKRKSSINYNSLVNKEFNEISKLEEENKLLLNQIKIKETERNQLFSLIIEEAEGRSVTNKVGKGLVYEEKRKQFDNIDAELKLLTTRNIEAINKNSLSIENLKKKKEKQIDLGTSVNQNSDGFLARLEAVDNLASKSNSMAFTNWFIILLFICIECLPIIVKILSQRGPYDQYLDLEEFKRTAISKIELSEEKLKSENYINQQNLKHTETSQAQIDNNTIFINEVSKAREEINQKRIETWRKQEIANLEKEESQKINIDLNSIAPEFESINKSVL